MGRILEHARGEGEIYEGSKRLGKAKYDITVYQRTDATPAFGSDADAEVDGLQDISGVVEPEAPLQVFVLMDSDQLTLRFKDGRRWDFAFSDSEGTAVNTGGQGLYSGQ